MKEQVTKIKICGLTNPAEARMLNQYGVDYAGFVLFCEKSRRNNSVQNAWQIMRYLEPDIKKVAVTVSPTLEQLEMIARLDFDYVQIHGELSEATAQQCPLPIFRAYNIGAGLVPAKEAFEAKIAGYVLDGKDPGSGKTFDWTAMQGFDRKGKLLILAGGLDADNVQEGIEMLKPDIVDVSSSVECIADEAEPAILVGKDEEKIRAFVRRVRNGGEYE